LFRLPDAVFAADNSYEQPVRLGEELPICWPLSVKQSRLLNHRKFRCCNILAETSDRRSRDALKDIFSETNNVIVWRWFCTSVRRFSSSSPRACGMGSDGREWSASTGWAGDCERAMDDAELAGEEIS
jgi:hypothetical protein